MEFFAKSRVELALTVKYLQSIEMSTINQPLGFPSIFLPAKYTSFLLLQSLCQAFGIKQ